MTNEESDLFQVRFTDQGKKFIQKFVAISYTMLMLVIFEFGISIYLNIKTLTMDQSGLKLTSYEIVSPYVYIFLSVLGIVSNVYYLKFPRMLFNSLKINDEVGANRAFKILFKGTLIFFLGLLLGSADMIWNLISRRGY